MKLSFRTFAIIAVAGTAFATSSFAQLQDVDLTKYPNLKDYDSTPGARAHEIGNIFSFHWGDVILATNLQQTDPGHMTRFNTDHNDQSTNAHYVAASKEFAMDIVKKNNVVTHATQGYAEDDHFVIESADISGNTVKNFTSCTVTTQDPGNSACVSIDETLCNTLAHPVDPTTKKPLPAIDTDRLNKVLAECTDLDATLAVLKAAVSNQGYETARNVKAMNDSHVVKDLMGDNAADITKAVGSAYKFGTPTIQAMNEENKSRTQLIADVGRYSHVCKKMGSKNFMNIPSAGDIDQKAIYDKANPPKRSTSTSVAQ